MEQCYCGDPDCPRCYRPAYKERDYDDDPSVGEHPPVYQQTSYPEFYLPHPTRLY